MAATGSSPAGRRRLGRRGEVSFEMCQTTSTADKSQSQRWGETAQPALQGLKHPNRCVCGGVRGAGVRRACAGACAGAALRGSATTCGVHT